MPQRTYDGPVSAGTVTLPTRRLAFVQGQPVEVTDDEARRLDADPEWASPERPGVDLPPYDPADPGPHWSDPDLDRLDRAGLLALADELHIETNRRLGEPKLRQVLADAIHANEPPTPQGDEPAPQETTP